MTSEFRPFESILTARLQRVQRPRSTGGNFSCWDGVEEEDGEDPREELSLRIGMAWDET